MMLGIIDTIGAELGDGIMAITLHLRPEIEAAIEARAQARQVPVETLLQEVIDGFAVPMLHPKGDTCDFVTNHS